MQKTKKNSLPIIGLLLFCTSFILSHFFIDESFHQAKIERFDNLLFMALMGVVFAPVAEEFSFRGMFIKRWGFLLMASGSMLVYCVLTHNYYLIGVVLIYLLLTFLDYKKKMRVNPYILYVLNSAVFALIHYKLEVFESLVRFNPVLGQFGVGLCLIWVTLNFGLVKSMICHSLFNLVAFSSIIVPIQIVNQEVIHYKNDCYKVSYNETPILGFENGGIEIHENRFTANKMSILKLMNYLSIDKEKYRPAKNYFMRYDIDIQSLNSGAKECNYTQLLLDLHLIERIED